MPSEAFIAKWRNAELKERSASQTHFNDLCALLGEPTPIEADPRGEWYAFEYGAKKAGGGDGWADVWKKDRFGWEYKGKGKDLQAAFKQLQLYTPALQYPPLLIVSDIETIVIHTAFPGTVPEIHIVTLDDLRDHQKRQLLKWAFSEPERLRPGRTRADVTAAAAGKLGDLADVLCRRGHEPHRVAHFLNQCLFCLYAEDVGLLPAKLFERIVEKSAGSPAKLTARLGELFAAMRTGGEFLLEDIAWFNGGLFEHIEPTPLEAADIQVLLDAARMDWTAIEPAIFGTLFERGLDPAKRSQLGAHYTDPATIRRLIDATITGPLQAEWRVVKATIAEQLARAADAKSKSTSTKARTAAEQAFHTHLERLRRFQVLDPACGSGNFLYLALQTLKDLEHQANLEAEALGLHRSFPRVGPENIKGIELNPYAAELARVTLWIGQIQWMLNHGFGLDTNPVLQPLDAIEQRDALITLTPLPEGEGMRVEEAEWPAADVIVGNPPFLGDKKMLAELGEGYVTRVRTLYKGRVPGGADLVTYWFERARAQIAAGRTVRAGLVSTNSIRGGANRKVLERIRESGRIFTAWGDEEWINEGAAVRVSLVCFDGHRSPAPPVLPQGGPEAEPGSAALLPSAPRGGGVGGEGSVTKIMLDGREVAEIYADLTAGEGQDVGTAQRVPENQGTAFLGIQKTGPFEIPGEMARGWLSLPNPHGRPNSEVVKPWFNGLDITRRNRDFWIIDFGTDMPEADACLYEAPFAYAQVHVQPTRVGKREARTNEMWWIFQWSRPVMRRAIAGMPRFIVTPEVAKHRVFAWLSPPVVPDKNLIVIARSDDTAFGVLHSRFHELWSLKMCTWLGKGNDPRYTPTTTFETFPFPAGLTPNLPPEAYTNPQAEAIAQAARRLNELRENWLNPPEWVERVPEVVPSTGVGQAPGYPDRIIPKPGFDAELKKRTLTNLYNQRPAWLAKAHQALDAAVAAAYGWAADLSDEEVLRRLLALNRASRGSG